MTEPTPPAGATPQASLGPDASHLPGVSAAADARSAAAQPVSWTGKRVGNFRILSFLGRGSMGRVFRAEDLNLRRQVALKVFPTYIDQGKRRVRLERFIREAQSTAALDHPGIVRIFEAGEFKGWYFIAMELIEGASLDRMLDANGPFDPARVCQIAAEVAEALEFAHDHGVIHRDVKPDNILIGRGGRARLVDFGLAYRSDPNDSFHVIDEPVGTAFYMAPEIGRGHGATPASDQYSLAATMWTLLTGKPPFTGDTRDELVSHHIRTPVPDLRAIRADVPQGLSDAIYKALAKDPADRFISCDQFAKVVRLYTVPGGAHPAAPEPQAKNGWIVPVIAGVCVAAVVGAGLFVALRASKPDAAVPTGAAAVAPAAPDASRPPAAAAAAAKAVDAADAPFYFARFADNSRGVFKSQPTASSSTLGVLKNSSSQLVRDPQRGLVLELELLDDPKMSETLDRHEGWFVRLLAGASGKRDENAPRATRGYVGFWAKSSTVGLRVAVALDSQGDVTADRGKPKPVLSDGQWHCYEWNLEDRADWEPWLAGDGKIDANSTFTIDSIQLFGPNADATVRLSGVAHNPAGRVSSLSDR